MFEKNVMPVGDGYNPMMTEVAKDGYRVFQELKQAELKSEEVQSGQFWDTVRDSNMQFNQTALAAINQGTQGQGNTIIINQPNNNYYAPKKDSTGDILAGIFALALGIFIGKRF
jgi:hypothetical protein